MSTRHCILLSATLGSAPKESRIERPIAVLGVRWAVRLNGQAVGGCASKSPKIQSESEIGFVPRMTITNRTGLNVGSRITYMTWSSNHPKGGRKQAGPQTICHVPLYIKKRESANAPATRWKNSCLWRDFTCDSLVYLARSERP